MSSFFPQIYVNTIQIFFPLTIMVHSTLSKMLIYFTGRVCGFLFWQCTSWVCLRRFFLQSCCTLAELHQPHNYGLFTSARACARRASGEMGNQVSQVFWRWWQPLQLDVPSSSSLIYFFSKSDNMMSILPIRRRQTCKKKKSPCAVFFCRFLWGRLQRLASFQFYFGRDYRNNTWELSIFSCLDLSACEPEQDRFRPSARKHWHEMQKWGLVHRTAGFKCNLKEPCN